MVGQLIMRTRIIMMYIFRTTAFTSADAAPSAKREARTARDRIAPGMNESTELLLVNVIYTIKKCHIR